MPAPPSGLFYLLLILTSPNIAPNPHRTKNENHPHQGYPQQNLKDPPRPARLNHGHLSLSKTGARFAARCTPGASGVISPQREDESPSREKEKI